MDVARGALAAIARSLAAPETANEPRLFGAFPRPI
jgi:hypothetical protein